MKFLGVSPGSDEPKENLTDERKAFIAAETSRSLKLAFGRIMPGAMSDPETWVKPGTIERRFAHRLEDAMLALGSKAVAFADGVEALHGEGKIVVNMDDDTISAKERTYLVTDNDGPFRMMSRVRWAPGVETANVVTFANETLDRHVVLKHRLIGVGDTAKRVIEISDLNLPESDKLKFEQRMVPGSQLELTLPTGVIPEGGVWHPDMTLNVVQTLDDSISSVLYPKQ